MASYSCTSPGKDDPVPSPFFLSRVLSLHERLLVSRPSFRIGRSQRGCLCKRNKILCGRIPVDVRLCFPWGGRVTSTPTPSSVRSRISPGTPPPTTVVTRSAGQPRPTYVPGGTRLGSLGHTVEVSVGESSPSTPATTVRLSKEGTTRLGDVGETKEPWYLTN